MKNEVLKALPLRGLRRLGFLGALLFLVAIAWANEAPLIGPVPPQAKPGTNSEAFCAPVTFGPALSGKLASGPMPALLHEALTKSSTPDNPFLNAERAEHCRELLAQPLPVSDQLQILPEYAEQLLQAGRPEEALKQFETFERLLTNSQMSFPTQALTQLALLKGMCSLRLGELDNCLHNHTAESCILPIQGKGVHKQQRGSRAAVEALTKALERAPDHLQARWLLNIAAMTLGEYPDKVPVRWLIPPRAFESDYDIKPFPDVAGKLGLDIDDLAGGVVMDDFDNDGLLDLMVSCWRFQGQLRLFRNKGDGTFSEETQQAGLIGLYSGLNMIQGDYNNDGFVDVLILRGAWLGSLGTIPNSLLRNNGDFTFTDVTQEAGLLSYYPTQTAVWFDYNNDGWLDIFIGNEASATNRYPCELFRNNGNGTFTECASASGLNVVGFVKGVSTGDFNKDGRPDLYLSRRGEPNMLMRNDGPSSADGRKGAWKFTDVARGAGVTEPLMSFPCWFWDYDNDGWEDIFVSGYYIRNSGDVAADYLGMRHGGETPRLFRNKGDGTFADATAVSGLRTIIHTMGCNFGDLDNDGWLDFYAGTGDPDITTLIPSRMFRNNGGKKFQDVTTSGRFGMLQKGHAVAFGDLDNDGDQDIYSVVGGAYSGDNYRNQLFANPGHGNHWLKLKLEGTKSNRSALGARIKVMVTTPEGERSIHKVVRSGASFGASPLRQEFGLGAAQSIVRVEIVWPTTGRTQVLEGLEMDRYYHIKEGQLPASAPIPLATFNLNGSSTKTTTHGTAMVK